MPHLQERQILFPTLQKCKDTAEIVTRVYGNRNRVIL